MEGNTQDIRPRFPDRRNFIMDQSALDKLIRHGIINGPPDALGFLTIVRLPFPLPLPFEDLKFEKIPQGYDTMAYLIYLGFKQDQAEIIFNKCVSELGQPSDMMNVVNITRYVNDYITQRYREPIWATNLDVNLVSEVARLRAKMQDYLNAQKTPEEMFTTLHIQDYIKEAMWQRRMNLTTLKETIHANLD